MSSVCCMWDVNSVNNTWALDLLTVLHHDSIRLWWKARGNALSTQAPELTTRVLSDLNQYLSEVLIFTVMETIEMIRIDKSSEARVTV